MGYQALNGQTCAALMARESKRWFDPLSHVPTSALPLQGYGSDPSFILPLQGYGSDPSFILPLQGYGSDPSFILPLQGESGIQRMPSGVKKQRQDLTRCIGAAVHSYSLLPHFRMHP